MRGFLMPLAMAAVATLAADAATPKMDGWFPCNEVTFAEEENPNAASGSGSGASQLRAECATFKAPLCYDGICDSNATTSEIDIFVKRIKAVAPGKPNIFFMQGGPGAASPAMESAMTGIYALLSGNVNVYTMDHRGTGRSTKLDCVAAQAMTSASPGGSNIDPSEVASCAADLEIKYGPDRSAFSITSAASDLNLFITSFLNGSTTFVYGVSYGTALVERLIHLNTTGISGYILDGISTTSGSDVKNFEYFSKWDTDYNEVAQYFLSFCASNADDCGKYFKDTSVTDTLKTLTANIDSPQYKCSAAADAMFSALYSYTPGSVPPSQSLRMFLGTLFADAKLRKLIPVVTYRLTRCNGDDVKVLSHLVAQYAAESSQPDESDQYESDLTYKLIVYSEMWETPTPSSETMTARFLDTTVSSGSAGQVETYCVFTKENSPGCKEFANETNYKASPLVYKRDKYWNVAASPPSDVSVLLMSSKMDPQTPHKYAEYLLAALDTDNKQLVVFEQATHGTLWSTPLSNTDPNAPICGMLLVASYVAVGGDLSKMDKSCVAKMPAVSFAVSDKMRQNWLNTTSAMDGTFTGTASDGADGDSTTSYKTVFIVFLVLFVVMLLAAAAFLFKWRQAKKTADRLQNTPVYEQETQA